jgi:cysteate synthase
MLRHPHSVDAPYLLRCTRCGAEHPPDPFRLTCSAQHAPALLRSVYTAKRLVPNPHLPGLFQFSQWLPIDRPLPIPGKPITYTSEKLAAHLGLDHLFISFNGSWAERNAQFSTCSFKELEAATVLARIPANPDRTLVMASAGNSGRAFANLCSAQQIPLCLVVPVSSLPAIWLKEGLHSSVFLIAVDGDYSDAIDLARLISEMDGFFPEGGVSNVARRDGMGLTVVDAAVTLGRIPDHYFQAIGSGSGGIAAWEANLRLLEDGRFGSRRMKLHLSQNAVFSPIVDAWKAGSPKIAPMDAAIAKARIRQAAAAVLTNRQPAYSITGGLYEALVETQGQLYAVSNSEAVAAMQLFEHLEGIDICAAAGVAVASLIQAIAKGTVGKSDHILLNITSGGLKRMEGQPLQMLQPDLVFSPAEIVPDLVAERIGKYNLCAVQK